MGFWYRLHLETIEIPGLVIRSDAHQPLPEIHSCISLIEQAAGLPFDLIVQSGDLPFEMCNMGGELISVEGFANSIGQTLDPGLLDGPAWPTREAWFSFQNLIAEG